MVREPVANQLVQRFDNLWLLTGIRGGEEGYLHQFRHIHHLDYLGDPVLPPDIHIPIFARIYPPQMRFHGGGPGGASTCLLVVKEVEGLSVYAARLSVHDGDIDMIPSVARVVTVDAHQGATAAV